MVVGVITRKCTNSEGKIAIDKDKNPLNTIWTGEVFFLVVLFVDVMM